jgi:hypothetical protein
VNGYVWNTNPARGLYTRERLRADAAVSGAPARGVYFPVRWMPCQAAKAYLAKK